MPVDPDGIIDLDALAAALDGDVSVVSVMLANNEVGTIQPLGRGGRLVRRQRPTPCCTPTPCRPFRGSTSPIAAAAPT